MVSTKINMNGWGENCNSCISVVNGKKSLWAIMPGVNRFIAIYIEMNECANLFRDFDLWILCYILFYVWYILSYLNF